MKPVKKAPPANPVPAGPDWKDWQNTRADLETDSTSAQERFVCPRCRAEYARQEVQAAFDFTFEGLDEYPQYWRRSWVRCQNCGHQYLVDDERSAADGEAGGTQ
ncbi:hypothetical protein [Deinococcus altitudinis]|uniref:hypothetical protein n=1 Tax=Deinococcus altitudinis TaxID=468914 RepID=UPI003892B50E